MGRKSVVQKKVRFHFEKRANVIWGAQIPDFAIWGADAIWGAETDKSDVLGFTRSVLPKWRAIGGSQNSRHPMDDESVARMGAEIAFLPDWGLAPFS